MCLLLKELFHLMTNFPRAKLLRLCIYGFCNFMYMFFYVSSKWLETRRAFAHFALKKKSD